MDSLFVNTKLVSGEPESERSEEKKGKVREEQGDKEPAELWRGVQGGNKSG
jgi:hypothetical protein